jgi:hypothetical protein
MVWARAEEKSDAIMSFSIAIHRFFDLALFFLSSVQTDKNVLEVVLAKIASDS